MASHAGQLATWASSAARSAMPRSPSRYSESRSVHWSRVIVHPPSLPRLSPSSVQMLSQRHARVMQLRFRRPGHDPQHARDLLVLVAFQVVQYEHLARAVGEPPDRLLEVQRQVVHDGTDRKSTRLNSSHSSISYAVFCLKKKQVRNRLTQACRLPVEPHCVVRFPQDGATEE